jgi:hypothetical protein
MKTRIVLMLVTGLAVVVGILGYLRYDDANRDFSPWMSFPELTAYLKKFDPKSPDEPDFWKKGHWITAAEGRWHAGAAQFRIRYGLGPVAKGFAWRWFIDQDQESFGKRLKEFGDDGFVLVCSNSFKRPDGTMRYQAVWHKTGGTP